MTSPESGSWESVSVPLPCYPPSCSADTASTALANSKGIETAARALAQRRPSSMFDERREVGPEMWLASGAPQQQQRKDAAAQAAGHIAELDE